MISCLPRMIYLTLHPMVQNRMSFPIISNSGPNFPFVFQLENNGAPGVI